MKLPFPLQQLPAELQPQAAPGTWEGALAALPAPSTGSRPAILNCGAGRGGLSRILGAAGYAVTSVDLHPEHFVAPGLTCLAADLNRPLEFAAGSFQAILAVEVIEHLEHPWGFLREAVRVLADDGVMVVTSPNVMSWQARLAFFRTGILPYFRLESFEGCYHVSPIFSWGIERCLSTTSARLEATHFSRNDWPRADDIPRFDEGKGWRRWLLDQLPRDQRFGEIAVYRIRKTGQAATIAVGTHYA